MYVLEGRVETRFGPRLERSVITEAGDFLFILPDVPHQPINLSATEAARAIVVRNDPNEQEHVILYDPSATDSPVPTPSLERETPAGPSWTRSSRPWDESFRRRFFLVGLLQRQWAKPQRRIQPGAGGGCGDRDLLTQPFPTEAQDARGRCLRNKAAFRSGPIGTTSGPERSRQLSARTGRRYLHRAGGFTRIADTELSTQEQTRTPHSGHAQPAARGVRLPQQAVLRMRLLKPVLLILSRC